MIAAWNASTHRLCTPITASGTSTVILTADVAGVPFHVASSTTDGGGSNTQTFAGVDTTPNIGGGDASAASNYYNNVAPASSGDSLTIDGRSINSIAYGLNQSANTLDVARVKMANGNNVGTTSAYFQESATLLFIGELPGDGSTPPGTNLIAWDTGSNASTQYVYNSASAGTTGLPTINLKGSSSSNILNVLGGNVGIATLLPGDTSTYGTANVESGRLTIAGGVTITNVNQNGGIAFIKCAATTIKQDGGTATTSGTGAITTYWCGGKTIFTSTGKVTTLEIPAGGYADFSQLPATSGSAVTIADDIIVHAGGTLNLDNGIPGSLVTTNPVQLYHASTEGGAKATILMPKHMKLTIAKI